MTEGLACLDGGFGACSPTTFRSIIRHERARVARNGGGFALVVWDFDPVKDKVSYCREVLRRIHPAMRSVDVIGWLEPGKLAVLLPSTNGEGARTFARHAREAVTADLPLIPHAIILYPDDWDRSVTSSWEEQAAKSGKDAEAGDAGADSAIGLFFSLLPEEIPLWKRWIDVAGSIFGLIVLSPLFALIAVSIKCVSPGRVFFRQARVGRGGRIFQFLKFRTMHEKSDDSAHREYLKSLIRGGEPMRKLDEGRDPRVIPGGGLLRKASLDELPQLINVLRGEMSLVGPRPCIPYEAKEYLCWHAHRFDILPGMTGLWQVSGKNRLSFEKMIRLDISYAKRMSFSLDMKILLRTVPTLFGLVAEALVGRRREAKAGAAKDAAYKDRYGEGRLSHV
jgi:lipopolysaccharide/colanic/teichoic acid biosynthesis glycosyltransferase